MVQQTSAPAPGPVYQAPAATVQHNKHALPLKILRITQFVFAVIVLGLVADVVNVLAPYNGCSDYYDDYYGYYDSYSCFYTPRTFYYNLFAPAWTILITIYLIAASFVPRISIWAGALVLDVLSIIIWFAAFVALAVYLGIDTAGYGDGGASLLQELEAADVFGALLWVSFILTMVFTIFSRRVMNNPSVVAAPMQQYPQQQGVAQHA